MLAWRHPHSPSSAAPPRMAQDLATTPTTGIRVQACGDAHIANFGAYAAPDRRLVFDLNDFDETLPAPWEWDVKRLAASIAIAGRDNDHREAARHRLVTGAVAAYRRTMREMASLGHLEVWYSRIDVKATLAELKRRQPQLDVRTKRVLKRAKKKDNLRALNKLTERIDGVLRFRSDPPFLVPARELPLAEGHRTPIELVREVMAAYRSTLRPDLRVLMSRYLTIDVARKVVGVGSVGSQSWVTMLDGGDDAPPLFLQVKQAGPSVLERFVGPSEHAEPGERVAAGQRLMQTSSDPFLGWTSLTLEDRCFHYYVRQLWDWKWSATLEGLSEDQFAMYAALCGRTLARAHARSGDRRAIAAYLGSSDRFDRAIAQFAETYADVNAADHAALVSAIDSGLVSAT